MTFELEAWGDGTTRLAHWDAMHGVDIIFVLHADGGVSRSVYDENGERQLESVDLVVELRKLAK